MSTTTYQHISPSNQKTPYVIRRPSNSTIHQSEREFGVPHEIVTPRLADKITQKTVLPAKSSKGSSKPKPRPSEPKRGKSMRAHTCSDFSPIFDSSIETNRTVYEST